MTRQDEAEFEQFATAHLATILHVCGLLTANKLVAEDLTLYAMRHLHKRSRYSSNLTWQRLVYAAVIRGYRRRRNPAIQQASGPLELHDLRPESATATVATPSPDSIIRDGLRALSDGERAVLVLHLIAELDLAEVARVVRRPGRVVRRDLATAMDFLADASSTRPSLAEERISQALRPPARLQSESTQMLTKLQTIISAEASRPRTSRTVLIGGAAVATAAVVVAAFMVGRSGETDDVADGADRAPVTSPDLPRTASGLKLVGFERIMVTVPEAWTQSTPLCINVDGQSVLYPMDNELPPCTEATQPGQSVAFGRYASIEADVTFNKEHRSLGGEPLLLSNVVRGDGEFLQYAALANADVAVSVRSTKRADLAMVLSSVQEVPAAYVVVPNCLKLDPDEATDLLADSALNGKVFSDPSNASLGLSLRVATQSPPVGTLLPFDATVNLGVLPR